jgi:hypothetical protein
MRWTRMNTAPRYHSRFALVARLQSEMRNGMEEVAGSIPARSTKFLLTTRTRKVRTKMPVPTISAARGATLFK